MIGAVAGLGGCGASSSFEAGYYRDGEASYRVAPPASGWTRVGVEDQNDLAWVRPEWSAVIQTNSSCDPGLDIPLEALTNHLLIGFTDRQVKEEREVAMAARGGLRTHLQARLDGVPRELLLYVVKKNGCVYDLALVAPPGPSFARARADFERLVAGFRTEPQP